MYFDFTHINLNSSVIFESLLQNLIPFIYHIKGIEKVKRHICDTLIEPDFHIFQFVLDSKEDFKHLKKLIIRSDNLDARTKDSFLYETQVDRLHETLINLLKKFPILNDLEIHTFCDDDILADIIAKYCPNLRCGGTQYLKSFET